ncbi:MAG: hypothetical protein IPN69_00035 [Acidobacteria bacterium]|nr:hypothetical protein [Acidobacteriota bacterium]
MFVTPSTSRFFGSFGAHRSDQDLLVETDRHGRNDTDVAPDLAADVVRISELDVTLDRDQPPADLASLTSAFISAG